MLDIIVAFVGYTIWGVVDYINSRLIFDKFLLTDCKKKEYNYFMLIFYVCATYGYCAIKYIVPNQDLSIIYSANYVLIYLGFYLRIVPFIWTRFGISLKVAVIYFFYEIVVAVLSTNLSAILSEFNLRLSDVVLTDDLLEIMVAIIVLVFLEVLNYFKRTGKLNIWFAGMATWEYVLMIAVLYSIGTLESLLYNGDEIESYLGILKLLVVVSLILIVIVIFRMLLVRKKNNYMGMIIDVLGEQMEKLTGYYCELNKKDEELRQFRHDTKNMLMVLQSMIKEKRNEQAVEYMEKMDKMFRKSTKIYDTGNFIADALLNDKSQEAEKLNTKIVINGFIPAEKISDVDMVILLSNLLDNAIEACALVEGEKKIEIDSVLTKQMWCMEVRNPVKEQVEIKKNHINTSKENKETHGYGLMNIERTALNYKGTMKLKCENKCFTTKIVLMLE